MDERVVICQCADGPVYKGDLLVRREPEHGANITRVGRVFRVEGSGNLGHTVRLRPLDEPASTRAIGKEWIKTMTHVSDVSTLDELLWERLV